MELASLTDHGLVRRVMDDEARVSPRLSLAVVAQRKGGTATASLAHASRIAVDAFEAAFSQQGGPASPVVTEARMLIAAQHAHEAVRRSGEDAAGSTFDGVALTAVAFAPDAAVCIQIGSTRGFRVRSRRIMPLTDDEDDVVDADLLLSGGLGSAVDLQPTVVMTDIDIGDVFVICSDAVWRSVSLGRIATEVAYAKDARDTCARIVGAAWAAGDLDNVAVAVVRLVPSMLQIPEPELLVMPRPDDASGANAGPVNTG